MARVQRTVGAAFLVLGVTLLLFVVYLTVGTSLQTNAKQAELATEIAARLPETYAAPDTAASDAVAPPRTVLPPAGTDGTIAWGRIEIPKVRLTKVLVEGSDRGTLKAGPGHYVETPLPGAPGPVGIAGHRTTWGAPFRDLDRLNVGDEISITTAAGRYRYRVTGSTIVHPRDGHVLRGDPESAAEHRLVLTTCHPRYSAARRLIVFADLDSWEAAA